jgi:hypothetical protein
MTREDVIEYYKSIYGREPSEEEIQAELNRDTKKPETDSAKTQSKATQPTNGQESGSNSAADLNARVKELEKQLAQQKQAKENINIFERIVPNRAHFIQVLEFMKDNAISMFIILVLAVLLPSMRWWLMLLYLVFVYFYPLLSTNKRFWWDKRLDEWFHDKNNLNNIYKNTVDSLNSINQTIRTNRANKGQTNEDNAQLQQELMQKMQEAQATGTPQNQQPDLSAFSQPVHHGFKATGELIVGIIALICGTPMFFIARESVSDAGNQLSSIFSNGSLDSSDYLYIIGLFLMAAGALALIGGIVKGATGHNGGGLAKAIGLILGLIVVGVACYIYANPVDSALSAARAAYDSGASVDDMSTAYKAIKIVPWIAAGLYGLGILLNGLHTKRR